MSREGIPGCRNISHANRATQGEQAEGLLKERKRTYAPKLWAQAGQEKRQLLGRTKKLRVVFE